MKQWISKNSPLLALAAPLGTYLSFIAIAFGMGYEYSCGRWMNWGLYYYFGVFSLLGLFVLQLCLNRAVHILWRLALALIAVAAGIGAWAWAFDAGGLQLLCGGLST